MSKLADDLAKIGLTEKLAGFERRIKRLEDANKSYPPVMPTDDKAELREELRQGSEAKHFANRLTPDGKEYVEMIPLEWAEEVIVAHTNTQIAAVLDRLTAEMNLYTAGHDAPMRDEALEAIQTERDKLNPSTIELND